MPSYVLKQGTVVSQMQEFVKGWDKYDVEDCMEHQQQERAEDSSEEGLVFALSTAWGKKKEGIELSSLLFLMLCTCVLNCGYLTI